MTPLNERSAEPARHPPVCVIAPTYREAANIPPLVERVDAALSAHGIEWELLLIDDESDDGSEAIVEGLSQRLPVRMEVRRGLRRDLSLAVLHGIRHSRFDRLVVMDADLSHPPESIVDLLGALDGDCDMVVGSRYAPGGAVDRGWSRWRLLNSRLATLLALPLVCCADPMSGFFAIDRRTLPDLQTLQPIGYKIGLELMVRGGLRVRETPIRFMDRDRGASKMNWQRRLDFLRHLVRLYLYRFGGRARLLSFALVGASGFVVDMAGYLALAGAGVEHRAARFLSFWPAVTWNWLLNRKATFRDRPAPSRACASGPEIRLRQPRRTHGERRRLHGPDQPVRRIRPPPAAGFCDRRRPRGWVQLPALEPVRLPAARGFTRQCARRRRPAGASRTLRRGAAATHEPGAPYRTLLSAGGKRRHAE